jgi:hypothetical protein
MSDLKLRPIGEDDYSVIREGRDIGRIRATYHHVKQVQEWSWGITVPLPMGAWSRGSEESLDAAKDAFRTAWENFYSSLTPEQIERLHRTQDARRVP